MEKENCVLCGNKLPRPNCDRFGNDFGNYCKRCDFYAFEEAKRLHYTLETISNLTFKLPWK